MTLHIIGLGLGDERDISVRGLEIVKTADIVYLEQYTSILGASKEELEKFYGKDVLIADRDLIEKKSEEEILRPAQTKEVVLLVVGDPFGATTHTDLVLRARSQNVPVHIVHNASILNAVGVIGLELYKFGRTASIPYWDISFEPESAYDVIRQNKDRGLHTLCLLDIKVKEPSREELRTGVMKTVPSPKFMSVREGLEILLQIEKKRSEGVVTCETPVIGVARIGQENQYIKYGTVRDLLSIDFGAPLHSIIIPGTLQVIEEEALTFWK